VLVLASLSGWPSLAMVRFQATLGDRVGEIQALRGLALCHKSRGETTLAKSTLSHALRLARQPTPMLMGTIINKEIERLSDQNT
jgi:hypothetical protein